MTERAPRHSRSLALLASPRLPLFATLLGVALALPCLGQGLMGDDWIQRLRLLGRGIGFEADSHPVTGLFDFYDGTREGMARMAESGVLPWWAGDGLHVAFMRPLAALTHVLDYALWPDSFALQHAVSLAWWALALVLVGRLFRELCGSRSVAGLATLLFAVEDAHALPIGWLANRNALLALGFGAGAILCHVRWRRRGHPGSLAAGLACGALALASGEAGLGALAYIAAWQVCLDRGRARSRLLGLLPWLALAAAWATAYRAGGYGAHGSGLYLDPGADPWSFAAALPERLPLLLAGQWLQVPVDLWLFLDRPAQLACAGAAVVICLALLALLRDALARDALPRGAEARFWGLGMVLSLVPLCGAFPMDRLLVFAGIGAFGLLALAAEPLLAGARLPRWRRGGIGALLLLHGPLAAPMLPARILAIPVLGRFFSLVARTTPTDPAISSQTLVFVNGNDFPLAYYPIMRMAGPPAPLPRRIAWLSSMSTGSVVERNGEKGLRIRPEGGFLASPIDRLSRDPSQPFHRGDVVHRPDYDAIVESLTPDGRPASVLFSFRVPLEDPSLRWMCFRGYLPEPWSPPPPGESVHVARVPLALPPAGP